MNVIKTAIDGVLIIEPRIFEDARGYFFESFSQREFDEKVSPLLQTSSIKKGSRQVPLLNPVSHES